MNTIVIIDYGMGNVGSVVNMFKMVGAEAKLSSNPAEIEAADKLVLPGVGAFDKAMSNLAALQLVPLLSRCVLQQKKPILGICLGMQLFANSSEEGQLPGLGWIDGQVKKFTPEVQQAGLKIPHMSWNFIKPCKLDPILQGLEKDSRFYFVHSYHFVCDHADDELSKTSYGYEFTSAVKRDNIVGVQFHPEKSHKYGMTLLENFVRSY